jgi:hypothetical protein
LKVTYMVFPGTAEKPFGPPNLERWKEKCAGYITELGGLGSGYELHTWEDKFKKPEPAPTPTPETVAPAAPADPATATPAATPAAPSGAAK